MKFINSHVRPAKRNPLGDSIQDGQSVVDS